MEKLKNILLYAGLDKEKNEKYKEFVLKQDIRNLFHYLIIAIVLFLCLGIVSVISSGFARTNALLYLLTAGIFCVLLILLKFTVMRRGKASEACRIYIFLFMAVLYAEAIMLTGMHIDQPAVTYIGILLILPLLFAQYPLTMIIFQAISVIMFCIYASYCKNPEIVSIDIWNGISFFFVSAIEIVFVIPMRFNQIIQPIIIKELSEKDMLTGLKNRNSFEIYCDELRNSAQIITCIYADANGLHELNNKYGHEAGDNMLRAVAGTMQKRFGNDNVYRIGGDEFIAFISEADNAQIEDNIREVKNELSQMGYHLSAGYAISEIGSYDIDALIKEAEVCMYNDKRAYYISSDNNRRRR